MYEVFFKDPAKRFLKKLNKETQKKIILKIEKLRDNPRIGKPLTGSLKGLWRLRHDHYRIIYQIKDQQIIIYTLNIGERVNIYK